jgi:hypothetical protein
MEKRQFIKKVCRGCETAVSNQETIIATLRHLKYRCVSCRMEWEEVVKLVVERKDERMFVLGIVVFSFK